MRYVYRRDALSSLFCFLPSCRHSFCLTSRSPRQRRRLVLGAVRSGPGHQQVGR